MSNVEFLQLITVKENSEYRKCLGWDNHVNNLNSSQAFLFIKRS